MSDETQLWWQEKDEAARASAVTTICDRLERDQAGRRDRCLHNVQIYEGRKLQGLFPSAYYDNFDMTTEQYDVMRLKKARSLVATACAKVAGKQKPKAQFMTTDADWTTKRKAKRMERAVEATMSQRQGQCRDGWEVARLAFRDCCVVDSGWMKYTADRVQRRVVIDVAKTWELYCDPQEARYGQPQNLFHIYAYDKFKLAARFPEKKEAILAAPTINDDVQGANTYGVGSEVSRMVKVRECWRLPPSPDEPGKHSIIVGSVDLADFEDYTRPFFPFEGMSWEPWMIGMYGASLVDNVADICDELNAAVERRSKAERLNSNGVGFYRKGTVEKHQLESNEIGIWIEVSPDAAEMPKYHAPETTSQGSIQWAGQLDRWAHDLSGVSEMSATGQTEKGVTAGVAMRTQENIASERFSIPWQTFETMVAIGGARQIVACLRELAEDGDLTVKWPGGQFLQEIDWEEADLEDDQFEIQVAAVSGLVNTPADRLQLASELYDRGILSQDSFLRVIQAKDIDAELERTNTQSQLIERYTEDWLDATPEREEKAKERGRPIYRAPLKWLGVEGLTEAIVQVGRAFMKAEYDHAPDYNLDFFLKFMGEADQQVQKMLAQQAQLQSMSRGQPSANAAPQQTQQMQGAQQQGQQYQQGVQIQ